jgi:hypothetical protein
MTKARTLLALGGAALAALVVASVALAQSGHFIDRSVSCADTGTQVECEGKVSGLGGTTFQIGISAQGTAVIECENPGENVAPGQDTAVTTTGTTGPLPTPRNGNFNFVIATDAPTVPNVPTCPNPGWTAHVVDVIFTSVTLTLRENGSVSDTFTLAL